MIGDAVAAGLCVLVVLTATINHLNNHLFFQLDITNNWESVPLFLPGMLYYVRVIWIQRKCLYSILQYEVVSELSYYYYFNIRPQHIKLWREEHS